MAIGTQVLATIICPRCGALHHNKVRYCDECYQIKKTNWSNYQRYKGSNTERGYGYKWRKLREEILCRDNYLCVECQKKGKVTPATEVDHIIPKAKGGTDAVSNLQSLCHACHKYKTANEDSKDKGVYSSI